MIVITTPTGQIGRRVLDGVLAGVRDSGEGVRVIARDPARLPARVRERVDVVAGSHADPRVLARAFAGADGVFWLVPPDFGARSIADHYRHFAGPARDAIANAGVGRVVSVSSLGRGLAEDAGPVTAALAMDETIRSTGVAHRALCPPGFMENMLSQAGTIRAEGVFFSPVPADRRLPFCATRDIAAAATALLLDPGWTGQEDVPLLGPEDLSNDDIARVLSDVLGTPVRFEQIPFGAYKSVLVENGMTGVQAQELADMFTEVLDRGLYDAVPRTPETRTPTSFRQWCEAVLKPVVTA